MKPCLTCGLPSAATRCDEHTLEQARRESRRDTEHPAYANRARWKNTSRRARAAQPWCLDCGATTDLTVDHIVPFRERPDLAYAQDNLTVRCRSHNSSKGGTMPAPDVVAAVEAAVAAKRTRRAQGRGTATVADPTFGKAQTPLHTGSSKSGGRDESSPTRLVSLDVLNLNLLPHRRRVDHLAPILGDSEGSSEDLEAVVSVVVDRAVVLTAEGDRELHARSLP